MAPRSYKIRFDGCFDEAKIRKLAEHLPRTYLALDELAPWMRGKWPNRVHCMSDGEIVEGRSRGAGHGYTFSGSKNREIWMSPYLSQWGLWLVLVHESLHHSHPDASEAEVNCVLLPHVFKEVFGERLDPEWARRHGVGAPEHGIGDRSYCR